MGEYRNSELVKKAMDQIVLKACIDVIPVYLIKEYRENACEYGIYRNLTENQFNNVENNLSDPKRLAKQLDVRAFLGIIKKDYNLYKFLAREPKDAYYIKGYCDELKNTYNRVAHPTTENYLSTDEVKRSFETMRLFLAGFGERYVSELDMIFPDNTIKLQERERDSAPIQRASLKENPIRSKIIVETEEPDLCSLANYIEALNEEAEKEGLKENINKYQLTDGVLKFRTSNTGYYSFTNAQSHNFPVTKNPKYPRSYKVFLKEDDEIYYDAQVFFCESIVVEVAIIGVFEDILPSVFIQAAESGFSTNLRDKMQSCFPNSPLCRRLIELRENPPRPLSEPIYGPENAVRQALSQQISVIWGPPGTGKTEVIAKICKKLTLQNERVLLTSASNIAIDEAVLRIGKNYPDMAGRVYRYGFIANQELEGSPFDSFRVALKRNTGYAGYSRIRRKYISNENEPSMGFSDVTQRMLIHDEVRSYEKTLISGARIVGTTLAMSLMSPLFRNDCNWDAVIIDEVSMASLPYVFCLSAIARKRVILVGDFRQLAPICKSGRVELSTDIFSFLKIVDRTGMVSASPLMTTLNVQYRMHPEIADCVKPLYDDYRTFPGIIDDREKLAAFSPFEKHAVSLIDCHGFVNYCEVSPISKSCFNVLSAMLSVRIAKLALPANISIITPFRAQTGLINALLDDEGIKDKVVVSTVHRFQGHESDIVVFDSVESFGKDRHLDSIFVGGNEEEQFPGRLINVASTRARGKLIVIADMQYLGQPTNSVEVQEVVNFMIRFGKKNCVFGEELKDFCIQHNDISEFKMFANDVPCLDYEKRSAESVELDKGVFLFGNRDDSDYSLNRQACKCVSKGKALYDWIMKNTL